MNGVATYDGFDFASEVSNVEVIDPITLRTVDIPKRHGALAQDIPVRGKKRIRFTGTIFGRTYDPTNPFSGLHTRINQYIQKGMLYNKQLRLHSDRYLKAYPVGFNYVPVEGTSFTVANFVWEFDCLDPFYYSDTPETLVVTLNSSDPILDATQGFYGEVFTINNVGSVFVYPKVTIVCTSASPKRFKSQFDNLTTGKSWTYEFDHPGGTKTVIVDAGIFSVTIDGTDDLTNWQGTFVWLDAGNNSMRVQGSIDAVYTIQWTPRYS